MQAATIYIRRSRGVMVVAATGRTGRGQTYVKGSVALTCKSISDPKFKGEMAAAVAQLLNSEA